MMGNFCQLDVLKCSNSTNMTLSGTSVECMNRTDDVDLQDVLPWIPTNRKSTTERPQSNNLNVDLLVIRSLTMVLALVAMLLNSLVLTALIKVRSKVLRSKFLIQNLLIVDFAMPLGYALRILPYVFLAFRVYDELAIVSVHVCLNSFAALVMFVQVTSAFVLACDRLYSIFGPVQYHMVGYTLKVKIILLSAIWLLAIGLTSPCLIIPYAAPDLNKANLPFYQKFKIGFARWTLWFLPLYLIASCLAVFALYVGIFVAIRWKNRQNSALQEASSDTLRKSYSLTLTYFASHVCTLFLYLPAPLFYLFRAPLTVAFGASTMNYFERLVQNIYIFNPIVDPVILYTRIRSIRQNMDVIFKRKG